MQHKQGSISVIVLAIGMILLLAVQLFVFSMSRAYLRQTEEVQNWQLRALVQSFMMTVSKKELPAGKKIWLQAELYPGKLLTDVSSTVQYSRDRSIRYLEISAENQQSSHRLKQVMFTLDNKYIKMAQKYGIISGKKIIGAGFLPDNVLYTGNEEVVLPAASYFALWSINELPADTVRTIGLCRRFYYIADYNGLSFAQGMQVSGSALIAADGTITFHSGCSFAEPVIFITDKKIIIEDNVQLDNVLLLAANDIVIGRGCKINGIIISADNIIFQGPLDFSQDEKMVARFSSVYYII